MGTGGTGSTASTGGTHATVGPGGPGLTRRRALMLALGALALSGGCVPLYRNHGYVPPEADLAALVIGQDTRETVVAAIGRPVTGGVLNDDGMYYVASRFRHVGPLEPQEVSREVLAITFDAGGTLRNIERFGLEDGQVVTLSRRVTDDNLRDTTFIRQLLGNIGRFDASTLLAPS